MRFPIAGAVYINESNIGFVKTYEKVIIYNHDLLLTSAGKIFTNNKLLFQLSIGERIINSSYYVEKGRNWNNIILTNRGRYLDIVKGINPLPWIDSQPKGENNPNRIVEVQDRLIRTADGRIFFNKKDEVVPVEVHEPIVQINKSSLVYELISNSGIMYSFDYQGSSKVRKFDDHIEYVTDRYRIKFDGNMYKLFYPPETLELAVKDRVLDFTDNKYIDKNMRLKLINPGNREVIMIEPEGMLSIGYDNIRKLDGV